MPLSSKPHPSARLGLLSLLAGVIGSGIAYLGLWIESDSVGLVGFSLVSVAVIGAVSSLLWNLIWTIRRKWRN